MVPAWCHDDKESIDEKIKTIDALFDELSTNVTSQSERIEPSEVGGPEVGGGARQSSLKYPQAGRKRSETLVRNRNYNYIHKSDFVSFAHTFWGYTSNLATHKKEVDFPPSDFWTNFYW